MLWEYSLTNRTSHSVPAVFCIRVQLRDCWHCPHLTWHVFRGWEQGDRGWPCSTKCCFHIASDSAPWQHVSGSYHSTGCAGKKKKKDHKWILCFLLYDTIGDKSHVHLTHSYHPVLILLWGIVHCCVPGIGATGVDFAYIEHPVPAGVKKESQQ